MAVASTALVPVALDAVTVPGHSSSGDADAGVTAVPMDDEATNQPVAAYFQFIQNNVQQIQAGNVAGVMREAEQRRREIMTATSEHVREQYNTEFRRLQSAMNEQLAAAQRTRCVYSAPKMRCRTTSTKDSDPVVASSGSVVGIPE